MKYKITLPVIPTDKEMEVIASKWWENHIGINFADWNDKLREYTFGYRVIPIDSDFINELLKIADGDRSNINTTFQKFVHLVSPALKEMDCEESFFLKLITRSPKDIMANDEDHGKPSPSFLLSDAMNSIVSSMRCFEDLVLLRHLPQASIVVRPFIKFRASEEWRVYIKDKKIVGISQYYYHSEFPELDKKEMDFINQEVRDIVNDIVIPNIPLNDFIADIIVGNENRPTVVLETNPYGLSDPCLFGGYEFFNGKTRWVMNGKICEL